MIAALLLVASAMSVVDSAADCRAGMRVSLAGLLMSVEAVNGVRLSARDSAIRLAGRSAREAERSMGQLCPLRSRPSLLRWVRTQGVLQTIATTSVRLRGASDNSAPETLYVVRKAKPTDASIASLRLEAKAKDAMVIQSTDKMLASIAGCSDTSAAKLSKEARVAVEACVSRAARALVDADKRHREREMAYLQLIEAQLGRFESSAPDSASIIVRSRSDLLGVQLDSVTTITTSGGTALQQGASRNGQGPDQFWVEVQIEIQTLIRELREPGDKEEPEVTPHSPVVERCSISGLAISPTLSLIDATTRVKTLSGDIHWLVGGIQSRLCGTSFQRFDLTAGGKYDEKTRDGGVPNITRHYSARAQELWQQSATPFYVSLTGNFLSDNSLALYLQQAYTASIGRLIERGMLAVEGSIGVAGVGQHFTTVDTSTTFAALALGLRLNYAVVPGGPAAPPGSLPAEISFGANGILGSRRTLATANAALKVPTFVKALSLTVKSWLDYVSNTPTGFKNHYWSIEIGPQIKIGTIP